jgi:hypothetical protein
MSEPIHKIFIVRDRDILRNLGVYIRDNWEAAAERGEPLMVEISLEDAQRSDEANRYYWGVTLKQVAEQAWWDGKQWPARAWHEDLKERFAPRIDTPAGLSKPMSTADMSHKVFQRYVKDCETYAITELHVQFVDAREDYDGAR